MITGNQTGGRGIGHSIGFRRAGTHIRIIQFVSIQPHSPAAGFPSPGRLVLIYQSRAGNNRRIGFNGVYADGERSGSRPVSGVILLLHIQDMITVWQCCLGCKGSIRNFNPLTAVEIIPVCTDPAGARNPCPGGSIVVCRRDCAHNGLSGGNAVIIHCIKNMAGLYISSLIFKFHPYVLVIIASHADIIITVKCSIGYPRSIGKIIFAWGKTHIIRPVWVQRQIRGWIICKAFNICNGNCAGIRWKRIYRPRDSGGIKLPVGPGSLADNFNGIQAICKIVEFDGGCYWCYLIVWTTV